MGHGMIRRFAHDPLAVAALAAIAAIAVCAIWGPGLAGYDPNAPDYLAAYQRPGKAHWFGTDSLGRDMAARILAGARISLKIAVIAALINLCIGVTYGAVSGYAGGRTDNLMMRAVDALYGVPTILAVILFMVYLGKGTRNIYLAIGLTYWLNMARLVRAEVLTLKQREYVQAARSLGARAPRIIALHILPNAAGVILVTLTLFIPEAIFSEAFLSYIGLGVPAPEASWGTLAADGAREFRAAPYLLFFPAAVLCVTMLAFNLLGDALRDAFSRSAD